MYNMHLIINTHWDREYRWSFSETQTRLAEAVDDLIDIMERDKNFTYFHTDSQVSMLDDYLDIRPERKKDVEKLVAEGRILTGPWYTLPAEFLVSGEALTRNLLMGHKISRRLGKVMKAGYNIFSWGQVSQLPQIYHQFGMDAIIFYRGVDQSKLKNLEFKWKAADGTQALGLTFGAYHRLNFWRYVYLPYILGGDSVKGDNHQISRNNLGEAFLTHVCDSSMDMINHTVHNQPCVKDIDAALKGLYQLIDTVKDKSSVQDLLFLQGFDQENPDPVVTELISELNKRIDFGKIQVSSMETYIDTVEKELHQNGVWDTMPTLSGEMLEVERVGDAFGPLYNGVFSARMPIKLQNSACQYLLSGQAEPLAAWASMTGAEYPSVMIERAWKELLKNQQHDGIGGCHVDRVTATMNERFSMVRDIGETVEKNALCQITGCVDFSKLGDKEIGVMLFNPSSVPRKETVQFLVDIPNTWGVRWSGNSRRDFHVEAVGKDGAPIKCQILSLEDDIVYGYLKFGNVIGFDATRCRLVLDETSIPANGYTCVTVRPLPLKQSERVRISNEPLLLENEFLKAEIKENGSISVTDKRNHRVYDKMHYFEDSSDKGGPLHFDPAYEPGVITTLSEHPTVELIRNGELEATYRISYQWKVPSCIETDLQIHVPHGSECITQGMLHRSAQTEVLSIVSEVTLRKDETKLRFSTKVDNHVRDHRLRMICNTGFAQADVVYADSPFDVVSRTISVPDSTGWYEQAATTWPTSSLVSVPTETGTVSIYHRGLSEYEVTDNASRSIALTLLRCFSTAGNPTETYRYQELAECQGEHAFEYAVELEDKALSVSEMWQRANNFNLPVSAVQTSKHKGNMPSIHSFLSVDCPEFAVTAFKQAEDGQGWILRGFLLSDEEKDMTVTCGFPLKEGAKVTMEEQMLDSLPVKDNCIMVHARPKEIVSIRLVEEK